MKRAALIAICIGALAAHAQSQSDWIDYAESTDGVTMAWNPGKTQKSPDGIITTWVRESPSQPTPVYKGKLNGPKYGYSINQMQIDCQGGRDRYVLQVFYSKSGSLVVSSTPSEGFMAAVPGTVGERLLATVCPAFE